MCVRSRRSGCVRLSVFLVCLVGLICSCLRSMWCWRSGISFLLFSLLILVVVVLI